MHAVRYSQIGLQKHSHGKTWIGGAVKPVNLAGVVWRNMEVGWKVTWSLGKHRWQPRRKPGQAPGVYCQPPYNAARRACVSLAVVVANRPLSSHTLRGLRFPPPPFNWLAHYFSILLLYSPIYSAFVIPVQRCQGCKNGLLVWQLYSPSADDGLGPGHTQADSQSFYLHPSCKRRQSARQLGPLSICRHGLSVARTRSTKRAHQFPVGRLLRSAVRGTGSQCSSIRSF